MSELPQIWRLLDRRQRYLFVLLQLICVVMAFSTLIGIAAIVPFFAVLGDPGQIGRSDLLAWGYEYFGFASERSFLVALGIGFVGMVIIANAINMLGAAALNRFAFAVGDTFRIELFRGYLYRDYAFHATANSASLLNNIVYEADRVTGLLQSAFVLTANAIATLFIVATAAFIDATVTAMAVVLLVGSYVVVYLFTRQRLLRNGVVQTQFSARRANVASEALATIKELIVSGNQREFLRCFEAACRAITRTATNTQNVGQHPRHVLECIAVGGLVGVALVLSGGRQGVGPWLPQLTFIGFAAYRLLPALQQAFHAIVRIRANLPAFHRIKPDLQYAKRTHSGLASHSDGILSPAPRSHICLSAVSLRYSAERAPAVRAVSLRIPSGMMVGLVGPNGSGKTTLVDLILGLLTPDSGVIDIDGVPLTHKNRRAWQDNLSYVPQQICLIDGSVAENIALGVAAGDLDRRRMCSVAQQVGLADFIESLANRYDEGIGECGIRLSGGQRQRLGIARALYRDSPVLIMDEATSALDFAAERDLLRVLQELHGQKTIILVAHRLSTVRHCDVIFEMHAGALTHSGSYAEMCRQSERFRQAASFDATR